MPPMAMLGLSLLYVQSHAVAASCTSSIVSNILVQPVIPDRPVIALDVGILLWLPRLDKLQPEPLFCIPSALMEQSKLIA